MRLVFLSDTHALHEGLEVPAGDVLVHSGDLTKRGDLEDVESFDAFLATLPHKHKIVSAGNHDFCFEDHRAEKARAALRHGTYLQDTGVEVGGLYFWGSPWQPWFFDWAFNLRRGAEIRARWDLIPKHTDILITHGPPLGHGDRVASNGDAVGCADLLDRIREIKPRVHCFGHIHEAYGQTHEDGTTFINASTCNLGYRPVNPPVVLDL